MNRNFINIFVRFTLRKSFHHHRYYSSSSYKNICIENLAHRTLLKLSGPDATSYLQGLITNDMQNFENENNTSCMYALFLNNHGRLLYDTLIYKLNENEYLLEYDLISVERVKKYLEKYKLRKDIVVETVDNLSVWIAYVPHEKTKSVEDSELSSAIETIKTNGHALLTAPDPRVKNLGFRILSENVDLKSVLQCSEESEKDSYFVSRFQLGIGEGEMDHPPGSCLPFETNMDFLNGVNFQKGCYIGQELTARVHFTGVIRKRMMPVVLSSTLKLTKLPADRFIFSDKDRKVGKLRNNVGKYGIAILNVDDALKANELKLRDFDIDITVTRPEWWPEDAYRIKH